MALHLSKESTKEEVILFLKENSFEESVIDAFESMSVSAVVLGELSVSDF